MPSKIHASLSFAASCRDLHQRSYQGEMCRRRNQTARKLRLKKPFILQVRLEKKAILWLEYESRKRNAHIHHQMCGHGGERMVAGHLVNGFCLETNTVFQFHGCHWHGCPICFPSPAQRREKIFFEKVGKTKTGVTRQMAYERTLKTNQEILKKGFYLVECWEHQITGRLPVELPKKKRNIPARDSFRFRSGVGQTKA